MSTVTSQHKINHTGIKNHHQLITSPKDQGLFVQNKSTYKLCQDWHEYGSRGDVASEACEKDSEETKDDNDCPARQMTETSQQVTNLLR